ncbi:LysR family transcriptional regulator [Myxococcota bacterium]|nr:LysR family transcriptional regulator [Myxococcota bacterium]MBU1537466.1 LysR family transcriptional regulator [Myxococcota bacterium]
MKNDIVFKLKLSLRDPDGSFMGIGLVSLLRAIETEKSIRKAAGTMSLSYPKALRIIRRLEEVLGTRVVETTRGGATGGGALVTDAGRRIMVRFEAMNSALHEEASRLFSQIFPDGTLL